MTITELEPAAEVVGSEAMAPAVYERMPSHILTDGISSGDHKVIGRLWIVGALLFGLFTLIADVLVRIERIDTDGVTIFSNHFAYEQWFTLGRIGLVFLFVMPLLIGIATTIVPLQIGAPSVAFPRAASAALWSWVVSGIIMVVSWAIDGGLIDRNVDIINSPTQLSMVSFAGVVISLIAASMVLITTIFTERSQGMSLYNVPLFTWSMLVACGIWLLSLPVLVANLVVMWVDARGDAFHSFGGDDLFGQVSWAVDQPQVFAYAIPVLGMLGELVPVAVRRRLKNYDLAMVAIAVFGAFTFGAYAQTYFNPQANTTWLFVIGSIALVVPVLAMIGVAANTVRAGARLQASSQLGLAAMALVALLVGGLVATVRVFDSLLSPVLRFINWVIDLIGDIFGPDQDNRANWIIEFDEWIVDTFDEVAGSSLSGAMVHLAVMAGLLAALAGLWYWAPKILGQQLPAGLGMLAGLSILGGAVLSAVPDAITGFMDQPDFVAAAAQKDGVEILNLISMIGSIGVLSGLGLVLLAIGTSFVLDSDDGDNAHDDTDAANPWGGHTLEWLTASPPAPGNFSGPYVVTSEAPLLDEDFDNPYAEAST